MDKILIAMSGGVDSSVTALLIKQMGCDCMGATMNLFQNEDIGLSMERTCCSILDIDDARSVASRIGIPYRVFNLQEKFKENVIDRFIDAYENGQTPNPCIDCNRYMKFGRLLERAQMLGYDFVATGHYARIEKATDGDRYLLKKALDTHKDQTYVLYNMTQEMLAHTIFPLGELTKDEVRRIADENGFVNAKKPESQDICFVKGKDYADFIEYYTQKKYEPGDYLDMQGNVIGRHQGIIRYTIGQRKGLGVSFGEPMYVYDKNPLQNTVTLARDSELYSDTLFAKDINLISVEKIDTPLRVMAKARYNQEAQPATATQENDDLIKVVFDKPQRAIAKGQAVVLYDGDVVVGGGTIV